MRRALSFLLAVLLTALAGCGPQTPVVAPTPTPAMTPAPTPQAEKLAYALPCYPESGFHPLLGRNRTNLALGGLLYEGLYELDGSFQAQNVLAAGQTVSEDGLTWTFSLRSGVTFSDGSALTAQDVAAALNQARDSALYAARLTGIKSVTAGEGSITVALSAPNGALPALLDVPISKGSGDRPLGTGPYVLTGDGENLALAARTGWWQSTKPLPLAAIKLYSIQEPDDLIYAFDTKEISMVSADLTGSNALGYSGSYETLDYPTTVMLYVGFNTRSGYCRSAGVRRALSRGFDRNAVATALLSRHAVPAVLPFHPASGLYDSALASSLEDSPQAMLEGFQAEGWKRSGDALMNGRQTMKLKLLVNQENTYKLGVADFLAAALSQSGIEVTVEKLPWEGYTAALEKGAFDLYLGEARLTADFDLSPLVLPNGALNYGKYTSAKITGLLDAYRLAAGTARPAAAKALSEALAEETPFTPLCFKNWSVLSQWGQVSGATPTQQNVFYRFQDWNVS